MKFLHCVRCKCDLPAHLFFTSRKGKSKDKSKGKSKGETLDTFRVLKTCRLCRNKKQFVARQKYAFMHPNSSTRGPQKDLRVKYSTPVPQYYDSDYEGFELYMV